MAAEAAAAAAAEAEAAAEEEVAVEAVAEAAVAGVEAAEAEAEAEVAAEEEVEEAEVEVEEAEEEIRHEKAPGSPDVGQRPGRAACARDSQPLRLRAAAERARASGRAGLACADAQRPPPEAAFRSWQSWAAVRKVPPASAGRPRRPELSGGSSAARQK